MIYCDTRINHVQTFTRDDFPVRLEMYGGGGTDFRPPFVWVAEESQRTGKRIAGLVYLTDLECSSYPAVPPDYPVLWVSTQRVKYLPSTYHPPFGEVAEFID